MLENTLTMGPVTRAISAMRSDQPRRNVLKAAGAALVGVIVGVPTYRVGRDLSAVAEAYLDDAAALGMSFAIGPDGNVWRATPVRPGMDYGPIERHWTKLNNRPPLLRAVREAVERGYQPSFT